MTGLVFRHTDIPTRRLTLCTTSTPGEQMIFTSMHAHSGIHNINYGFVTLCLIFVSHREVWELNPPEVHNAVLQHAAWGKQGRQLVSFKWSILLLSMFSSPCCGIWNAPDSGGIWSLFTSSLFFSLLSSDVVPAVTVFLHNSHTRVDRRLISWLISCVSYELRGVPGITQSIDSIIVY